MGTKEVIMGIKSTLISYYEVEISLDTHRGYIIKVTVPSWANWVTINELGDIYAFENEPTLVDPQERGSGSWEGSWWWSDGKKKYIDYTDVQKKDKVHKLLFKIEKDVKEDKKEENV